MTLKQLYRSFLTDIQTIYPLSEATNITDWIFESIANVQRIDMIKTPELLLPGSVHQQLQNSLNQLLRHKPIQYILGEAWFYNMKLKVNAHVLIPRPETEELVTWIINDYKDILPINILDIGSGCGCIPIALKKHLPNAIITSIDISEDALLIAKENALIQSTEIEFKQLDFLDENRWASLGTFDIIVSNPPYIPIQEKSSLDKNVVAYEPNKALFVPNEKPLLFYEKIARFGKRHLNLSGRLYMEIHENYGQETVRLLSTEGYKNVLIRKDLSNKDRMIKVQNIN